MVSHTHAMNDIKVPLILQTGQLQLSMTSYQQKKKQTSLPQLYQHVISIMK